MEREKPKAPTERQETCKVCGQRKGRNPDCEACKAFMKSTPFITKK